MRPKRALLIVDLQNDFCPGGALGISGGDKIVGNINKYLKFFSQHNLPIFASRDWHPKKSRHFKKFGGPWPVHCVRDTKGARFHPKLELPPQSIFLYKGMDPERDSYSVFQAEDENGISFSNLLKVLDIRELYIGGLATDYCVRFTAKDALNKGLQVRILLDAIKGVDLRPGDSQKAIKELVSKGAKGTRLFRFFKRGKKKCN